MMKVGHHNRCGFRRHGGRVWAVAAVLLFAWLPAATALGEHPELPKANQSWVDVQTANFRIFSNAGVGATRRVAADLEELRAVLAQLTDFELQSPVPTSIYIFKSDRSFTPYKLLYEGRPGAMNGYFLNGEHANYIAIDAGSRDASAIVYHEYVHYVMANNFWWLPVWLSEGLAEFYQTFEVVDDTAFIGLPPPNHLARLRGSTRIPLSELLTVDHESPLYNEENRKSDFYAESWALTHTLLLGDEERRQQLGRYLAIIGFGVPAETAFTEAFGPDLGALEDEIRRHLRGPRIPFLSSRTEIDIDNSMTILEMSYAEVLSRLGDLLASQIPERREATAYFEAALEADPNHSPALTALALEAEERGDWEAAAGLYSRTVRAHPNDPEALFHWGEFLSRRRSDSQQAVAALSKAARLKPSFAPAWVALSRVYAQLGETSPAAIVAAETAHRLEPANQDATQSLLRLYLRLDRRDQAVGLIEDSLLRNPGARGEAWMALLHNDLLRARGLLSDNRADAATARIDAAEKDVHRAARSQIIARGIADVRTSISQNEGARIYDLAFAEYERGDLQAARSLLEQALENLPEEGPVTRSCRHLMNVIDHPEEYAPPEEPRMSPTGEEINQLNRMLAAGDLADAIDFLRAIADRSSGARNRWIDNKILELQRTLDYNDYVEIYNAAVEFYNRQEFDRAISLLDEFLATQPEGPQATSARSLRSDAQRAIAEKSNGP